jgi:hypothetical protein
MVDRRVVLKSGIGVAAALFGASRPAGAEPAVALRASPDLVLVDRHLAGSRAFIVAAHGGALVEFTSDVARAWMLEIEPRLRAGPVVIEGYTSAATLFCLELLARDYGARVTRRSAAADGCVEWRVSSNPMQRAALAPLRFRRSTAHA